MSDSAMNDLAHAALSAVVNNWASFQAPPFDYPALRPLPDRHYVTTGTSPPADCEQLTVSVERTFGTEGSPALERVVPMSSGVPYLRVMVATIQIIRCCATLEGSAGQPVFPTDTAMDSDGATFLTDADVVLMCLMKAESDNLLAGCSGLALENWRAVPAQGGFAGGATKVRLALF